jgi:6-pyruvoyltetrahydropterin/6-carboxytetrahydropterin synthase
VFEIRIEDSFSAAHSLREYAGNCERLHGHNWQVQVTFIAEKLNNIDIAIDFRQAFALLRSALKDFDHQHLNDLAQFKKTNPTCENLSRLIYEKIKELLNSTPSTDHVALKSVTVWESPKTSATYYERG